MTHTEMFPQFVAYHQGGDANVEGRCIDNICDALVCPNMIGSVFAITTRRATTSIRR